MPVLSTEHRLARVLSAVDEALVRTLFHQTAKTFTITRVEFVRNPLLLRQSSDRLDLLDNRRSGPLKGIFNVKYPEGLTAAEHRAKTQLINVLKGHFRTQAWAGVGLGFSNVVPVWHGSGEAAVNGIAQYGFAHLVNDDDADPGWYGNGLYNGLQSQLATMYATTYPSAKPPNDRGEWVVLLSAAVIGVAYPITPCRADFPGGPLPPTNPADCRFFGHGFKAPCDAHVAGIKNGSMFCADPGDADFHEVVCKDVAQLLPLAKVYFSRS